ncbi:hypothetical protein [Effusibacillus lacus]|uniref:Uncharacterized protein n=1 Tax=Effusibacillus lacus TaxID=1348429 RepID=A0A292YMI3_9BACL|nr:hypothetical protein [Effusibacillus lacus]GAX91138.1 hypothetical protein EFBL_2804 [Effusibacillus lacus]
MKVELALALISIPVFFYLGRYSARYRFVRVRPRYRQSVRQFIRGK